MSKPLSVGDLWRTTLSGTYVDRHFHMGLDWSVQSVSGTPPH